MRDDRARFEAITVPISELRPHPRNYRVHPDDQLEHIVESIRQNGFYRNVVTARDGTILAGHGVVRAAEKMGIDSVPTIRLDLDASEPRALKVLAGDNEIGNLAEIDDRVLTEMLKEIRDVDGLLGTGFDDAMLANLVMVTRPASEIASSDAASEWVGMPEYDSGDLIQKIMVSFRSDDDRMRFINECGLDYIKKGERMWSCWWPPREREDLDSVRLEG